MTLNEVKPGHGGIISAVGGEGALRRRLLDMGLTPKTQVRVRKVAPMGDPIELVLRGYVLTLRGDDAAKIVIQTDEELLPSGSCPACEGHGRREHSHGVQLRQKLRRLGFHHKAEE